MRTVQEVKDEIEYLKDQKKLMNTYIGEYVAQGKIEHLEWVLQKRGSGKN
jgi:hypothetical protein